MELNENMEITGTLTCLPPLAGKPKAKYVFQKTRAGHGNIVSDPERRRQCRIWVRGTNPRTQGQQTNRAAFAAAVAEWHALTEDEKQAVRKQADSTGLNGYQFWLKLKMREYHGA